MPVPEPRPHSVLVRIEAVPLLSYLKRYIEGKLAFYSPPPGNFMVVEGQAEILGERALNPEYCRTTFPGGRSDAPQHTLDCAECARDRFVISVEKHYAMTTACEADGPRPAD